MIDDIDRRILTMLQANGRVTNAEIARTVGMAPSAILERIRKLEGRGVIQGYTARIDPRALGYGLLAFVRLKAGRMGRSAEILDRLSAIPEVQEVHLVVGDDCFHVKVRVRDTDALARLLQERLQRIEGIGSTTTTIVLRTAKEILALPIEGPDSLKDVPEEVAKGGATGDEARPREGDPAAAASAGRGDPGRGRRRRTAAAGSPTSD